MNSPNIHESRPTVGVVTVTYNSEPYFAEYMASLARQTQPIDLCVLVDSGSTKTAFLETVSNYPVKVQIIREANVGVCVGNNIGWRTVRNFDYILFLNPDAFISSEFIAEAVEYMEVYRDVGMITPTLLGYDIRSHQPTGTVDTTGVVRNWFGNIIERDQNEPAPILDKYRGPNSIPWVCTAVALARRDALNAIEENGQVFDESFFMYKDDTDVSWRIRRAGWKNVHHPGLVGYHCRGWKSRSAMSKKSRLLSARNDVKMHWKNRSPWIVAGIAKYALVRLFNA